MVIYVKWVFSVCLTTNRLVLELFLLFCSSPISVCPPLIDVIVNNTNWSVFSFFLYLLIDRFCPRNISLFHTVVVLPCWLATHRKTLATKKAPCKRNAIVIVTINHRGWMDGWRSERPTKKNCQCHNIPVGGSSPTNQPSAKSKNNERLKRSLFVLWDRI